MARTREEDREQELCGNYTLTFLTASHVLWLKTFPFWNGEITSGEKECKHCSTVKQLSIYRSYFLLFPETPNTV